MTIRASLYSRVSTGAQADEGISLEAQQDMAERYCRERGWSFVTTYTDVMTGKNDKRVQLRALELDAKAHRFDVVLVYKIDRLARSFNKATAMMAHLADHDVALVSMTEPLDLTTPMGKAIFGLLAGFAEQESENIGQRVRDAKKYHAAQGVWQSHRTPTGYRYTGKDGGGARIEVDEEWAPVVRRVFALFLGGGTYHSIAQALNDETHPTPQGALWHAATIRNMLVNPTYTGRVVHGRTAKKGKRQVRTAPEAWTESETAFPALVDATTWAAVQARIADLAPLTPRERYARTRHAWAGLIRCGCCGGRMSFNTNPKGSSYSCRAPRCTTRPSVSMRVLDGAVIAALFKRVEKAQHGSPKPTTKPVADHSKAIKRVEATIARAKRLALSGVLDEDEAADAITKARRELADLTNQETGPRSFPLLPPGLAGLWADITPAGQGEILRLLVQQMRVRWESLTVHLVEHGTTGWPRSFDVPIPRYNRPRRIDERA